MESTGLLDDITEPLNSPGLALPLALSFPDTITPLAVQATVGCLFRNLQLDLLLCQQPL